MAAHFLRGGPCGPLTTTTPPPAAFLFRLYHPQYVGRRGGGGGGGSTNANLGRRLPCHDQHRDTLSHQSHRPRPFSPSHRSRVSATPLPPTQPTHHPRYDITKYIGHNPLGSMLKTMALNTPGIPYARASKVKNHGARRKSITSVTNSADLSTTNAQHFSKHKDASSLAIYSANDESVQRKISALVNIGPASVPSAKSMPMSSLPFASGIPPSLPRVPSLPCVDMPARAVVSPPLVDQTGPLPCFAPPPPALPMPRWSSPESAPLVPPRKSCSPQEIAAKREAALARLAAHKRKQCEAEAEVAALSAAANAQTLAAQAAAAANMQAHTKRARTTDAFYSND